ncbi:hypothetical protein AJ79_02971 [Helicocarpus griseus UAMH5409]|uniref:Nucleoside phosphorylase domain-containing protein n=1 Tax=Helicocarpus griseus UAMH5409 TaxID=1447875 RepID=A0A2B7XZJ1_9EURO|nr:hypothetical protein AJ79_02971 [Helicocarpus griseus UAMH5409]
MSDPRNYTVGWICAIKAEYVSAQAFPDEKHPAPEYLPPNDNNDYTLGKVGKHNVVIAVLYNGEYGISSASSVAKDLLHSFPNVRIGLMVGVGGGAPSEEHDIRLGDIVASTPRHGKPGVFQYDFGKKIQVEGEPEAFRQTGSLKRPPNVLLAAVTWLESQYEMEGHQLENSINCVLEKEPRLRQGYKRPDKNSDRLYRSNFIHPSNSKSCAASCNNPMVHYGMIASGNQLMRDATVRDRLSAEMDVLCFETKAAGLVNHFPCLVIRGICNYSDSHKNEEWQGYAAMAASAYAKDLLCRIPPLEGSKLKRRLRLLSLVGPVVEFQQNGFLGQRFPGTGDWLLCSAEYQNWIQTPAQTLFCPGIPGAGKTICTSIVVDDLMMRYDGDMTFGIALSRQLSQCHSSFPSVVKDLYDRHRARRTPPSVLEISETLQLVTSLCSGVFLIIDALDECQATDGCRAALLKEIFYLQHKCGANIFATSRFFPEIIDKFENSFVLEISASSEEVHQYLKCNMERLPEFVQNDPQLQHNIINVIEQYSDGMFLIARLCFESLVEKMTLRSIKTALDSLTSERKGLNNKPAALDAVYEKAMKRIEGQPEEQARVAKNVLSWITGARGPLKASELQHALAVEIGASQFDEENIPSIAVIISVCAGLVTVDAGNGIIQFIHRTMQEYFERARTIWFPTAEVDIAKTCLTYVMFKDFGNGGFQDKSAFRKGLGEIDPEGYEDGNAKYESWPNGYLFYDYAARYWGYHAHAAGAGAEVEQLVLDLFGNEENMSRACWVAMTTDSFENNTELQQAYFSQQIGRE